MEMDRTSKIMDVAERRMRQVGYNAVSYRDIAAEVGVKSASLHYHFPKKEDLAVAVVRRYADAFATALETCTAHLSSPRDKVRAIADVYRRALGDEALICLCAVLGAEAGGLPPAVAAQVKAFFEANIDWLTDVFASANVLNPYERAKAAVSMLEGAMILSSVNTDLSIFEAAACTLEILIAPSEAR